MQACLRSLRWIVGAVAVLVVITTPLLGSVENQVAPDFSLESLAGGRLSLEDFKGKVLFINFWATWCPPCREEIPGFIEVYQKYKEEGMEILGVSLDRQGEGVVRQFAEKLEIDYPLAMGTQAIVEAYQPGQYIPATIVIDREGRIRNRHVGFLDKQELERLFLEYSK